MNDILNSKQYKNIFKNIMFEVVDRKNGNWEKGRKAKRREGAGKKEEGRGKVIKGGKEKDIPPSIPSCLLRRKSPLERFV